MRVRSGRSLYLRLESKVATAALLLWVGLSAGAVARVDEAAALDLLSFQEGETWEYSLRGALLRVERREGVIEVTDGNPSGEPHRLLLSCLIGDGQSRCLLQVEELEGRMRIRLLREEVDSREVLVLEAQDGGFKVVAGMLASSRTAKSL